jgi:hypothetical protein
MKQDEIGGICSMHREMINAHNILVKKPEGKRPLERHRHRREINIKMCFRVIRCQV